MLLELFWRFLLISVLAFGGGQAVLPLVEQAAVSQTGWVTAQDFATALAFSYVTPGPILIMATFIGYRAAGLAGAASATVGVFLLPWLLAAAAAQQLQRFAQHPLLRAFARGAGPAVVGLLGVTALSIARTAFAPSWLYAGVAVLALVVARWGKVHPFIILMSGAVPGAVIGSLA